MTVTIPTYLSSPHYSAASPAVSYVLFSNEKNYNAIITGMEVFTSSVISNFEIMVCFESIKFLGLNYLGQPMNPSKLEFLLK